MTHHWKLVMKCLVTVAVHPVAPVLIVFVVKLNSVEHPYRARVSHFHLIFISVLGLSLVNRWPASWTWSKHSMQSGVGLLHCAWTLLGPTDAGGCLLIMIMCS